jgi:hypothetical protein
MSNDINNRLHVCYSSSAPRTTNAASYQKLKRMFLTNNSPFYINKVMAVLGLNTRFFKINNFTALLNKNQLILQQ